MSKDNIGKDMDDKKYNLFIVILSYKVSLEKIDALRSAHLDFLSNYYTKVGEP
jgi:hypothetical protein